MQRLAAVNARVLEGGNAGQFLLSQMLSKDSSNSAGSDGTFAILIFHVLPGLMKRTIKQVS